MSEVLTQGNAPALTDSPAEDSKSISTERRHQDSITDSAAAGSKDVQIGEQSPVDSPQVATQNIGEENDRDSEMDIKLKMRPEHLRWPHVATEQSIIGVQAFTRKWPHVAAGQGVMEAQTLIRKWPHVAASSIDSGMNAPQFNLITGSSLVSSCSQQSSVATQTSGQGSGPTKNVATWPRVAEPLANPEAKSMTLGQESGSIKNVAAGWPRVADPVASPEVRSMMPGQGSNPISNVAERPRVADPMADQETRSMKLRKGKKIKVPDGYEARQRDNRFHLYRIHGYKLSSNGKRMKDRSYVGSYTEKGLEIFYEQQRRQSENAAARQHSNRIVEFDPERGRRLDRKGREEAAVEAHHRGFAEDV